MRKIGFIMSNKVLAQSLALAITRHRSLEVETFLFFNSDEAIEGIPILDIHIAVVGECGLDRRDDEKMKAFFRSLRDAMPGGQILVLISPDDLSYRTSVLEIVQLGYADDFIFLDASLDYLIAKMDSI